MTERARFNPWPLLPVFVLLATLVANIVLIRLATDTDDVVLTDATEHRETPGDGAP